MDTMSTGEKIAGASGVALLIIMFLSWWGTPEITIESQFGSVTAGGGGSFNAWEGADFMDIIWFITGVAGIALAATAAMAQTPALPVSMSAITAGLGILSTLLIVYRLIDPPYDASRKYGVFLGLIAAFGIAYGAWRAMEEEGTSFGGQADRFGGGTPPPPAPPAA